MQLDNENMCYAPAREDLSEADRTGMTPRQKIIVIAGVCIAVVLLLLGCIISQWYTSPFQKFSRALSDEDYIEACRQIQLLSGSDLKEAEKRLEKVQKEQAAEAFDAYNNGLKTAEQVLSIYTDLSTGYETEVMVRWRKALSVLTGSKNGYTQGKEYEQKDLHLDAIQAYLSVIPEDTNYDDAQNRLKSLKEMYLEELAEETDTLMQERNLTDFLSLWGKCRLLESQDAAFTEEMEKIIYAAALSGAEKLFESNNCRSAIKLLRGLETEDASIEKSLEEYSAQYRQQLLDTGAGYMAQCDYELAISTIEEAATLFLHDEELLDTLEQYRNAYRAHIFTEAAALAEKGDYHGAVTRLEQGVSYFGEAQDFSEKIQEYTAKFPVSLKNVTVSNGANYYSTDVQKDIYGNVFTEGLKFFVSEYRTADSTEYVANKNYTRFKGSLMFSSETNDHAEMNVKIYADGALKYDSGVVTKKTKPIALDVDISGATFVKIVVKGVETHGCVLIAEPTLGH